MKKKTYEVLTQNGNAIKIRDENGNVLLRNSQHCQKIISTEERMNRRAKP